MRWVGVEEEQEGRKAMRKDRKINFCGFCVLRCFNVALFIPRVLTVDMEKQKHQIKSRSIEAKGKTTKFFAAVKLKNIKFNKNKATAENIISVVPKLTQYKNFALNSLRWRNLVFCVTFWLPWQVNSSEMFAARGVKNLKMFLIISSWSPQEWIISKQTFFYFRKISVARATLRNML